MPFSHVSLLSQIYITFRTVFFIESQSPMVKFETKHVCGLHYDLHNNLVK